MLVMVSVTSARSSSSNGWPISIHSRSTANRVTLAGLSIIEYASMFIDDCYLYSATDGRAAADCAVANDTAALTMTQCL